MTGSPKFQGDSLDGYATALNAGSLQPPVSQASNVPVVWGKLHLPIKRTGPFNKDPSHAGGIAQKK